MKLTDKLSSLTWYVAAGLCFLSFWSLVFCLIFCAVEGIRDSAAKWNVVQQIEEDRAEELRQMQLEFYRGQTNREKP